MNIKISSGCRLHLGFLDLNGDLGRLFGSVGVALKHPRTVLTFKPWTSLEIVNGNIKRITSMIHKLCDHYSINPEVKITVKESIPEHFGLGSGTQLALALSTGLAMIHGIKIDMDEFASVMNRGERSGVGLISFREGGFIIDAGRKVGKNGCIESRDPNKMMRKWFPDWWRFLLIMPHLSPGLHGKVESKSINKMLSPAGLSEKICRLTLMKMLPSFLEKDIDTFGSSLTEIDQLTGDAFKDIQGGVYKDPISEKLIKKLQEIGAYGVGQSSWGPTLYGLVKANQVSYLNTKIRSYLAKEKIRATVLIGEPKNQGAEIEVESSEDKKHLEYKQSGFSTALCLKEPMIDGSGKNITHTHASEGRRLHDCRGN
jgi:beta-ribofuranosylaminobenzene 5'-phosphate synthase